MAIMRYFKRCAEFQLCWSYDKTFSDIKSQSRRVSTRAKEEEDEVEVKMCNGMATLKKSRIVAIMWAKEWVTLIERSLS